MKSAAHALQFFATDPSELASLASVRSRAMALQMPNLDNHSAGCQHHLDR
jgi:hypothetical protein